MINGTNLLRKDNPRSTNGNLAETIAFLVVGQPGPAAPRDNNRRARSHGRPRLPRLVRLPGVIRLPGAPGWLSGLTRQAGARLFAKNDAEARWHDWQITELSGGLGRSYRDPRFDALRSLRDVAAEMSARTDPACPEEQEGPLP